ncbi:hypothetical protein COEREDRAFT_89917 [Coemansia reversa NRRL 1564]|uniref:Uncharacterized protein n=1 Tax=Coemansia reversa (strain ATCC 12441 / NRRL 1564) TaxID=763665 RepID=A0A2G5B1T8_COERN|nr:hypothetical protein COEREDRAFT_89917 [Coemansia reversa NRRL 1564]|eukprot:PIA12982.1 hypothetical protein COEREDRAFT_89917 [Coemansia reversa NRRL 1564]
MNLLSDRSDFTINDKHIEISNRIISDIDTLTATIPLSEINTSMAKAKLNFQIYRRKKLALKEKEVNAANVAKIKREKKEEEVNAANVAEIKREKIEEENAYLQQIAQEALVFLDEDIKNIRTMEME